MKKYFIKDDGTIKLTNMLILIGILFFIVMTFVYLKFFKVSLEEPNETYKQPEKTSSINMCNDCDFYFTLDSLEFNVYSEYRIDKYLEIKNMSLNNIKFEVEDKSLFTIENKGTDLNIVTKNKVGKTKLVATYDKIRKEIEVNIIANEIKDISLSENPYYIYNGKSNNVEVITDPIGIDLSSIDLSVLDPNIAKFENGSLVGLSEGITKLRLLYNGVEKFQDLYVYNDLIHVEVMDKNKELKDLYKIGLKDFKNDAYDIIVSLDDNFNKGYSLNDLVITHEDNGVEVTVTYDGKYSLDKLSYKYRITINGTEGSSLNKFALGNSTRLLEVGE